MTVMDLLAWLFWSIVVSVTAVFIVIVLATLAPAESLPYGTLQEFEKHAKYRGQALCGPDESSAMMRLFLETDASHGFYAYFGNQKFAIAKVDRTQQGDNATYIWEGAIRDKGVLDVEKEGTYTPEAFGQGPCPFLFARPQSGICGSAVQQQILRDLDGAEICT